MPRFGWMRLAYLLLVLTILVSLARVGGPDAEARSLSARAPDNPETPSGQQETPQAPQLTEDVISSLEDIQGSTGRPDVGPNIVEPRIPPVLAPETAERRPTANEQKRQEEPVDEEPEAVVTEPPVFYRPPDTDAAREAGPVCGNVEGVPEGGRIVFPLEKRFYYSYSDTWGAPRTQGGHEGTDLMTPSGVPEYAVTDGTVVPVAGSNPDGWNTLGGYAVMVRADYSIGPVRQGDLFYYAHLERESALPIGARVQAGQVIGYTGDTGQGPPGTSGLFPPHLHLGWYDAGGDREQADSGAMNPYPLLEWIKANGGAVTGDSEARFCESVGPPPPTGWPEQGDPGLSPDLDTGSTDPKPSPAQRETREETPKPDPAEKTGRRQTPPTNNPPRPNPPEKQPQRDPDNPPAKPQNTNRTETDEPPKPVQQAPEPPKPVQQAPEPPKQERPPPDQTRPDPIEIPDQPEPPDGPYDDAEAAPDPEVNSDEVRTDESSPE